MNHEIEMLSKRLDRVERHNRAYRRVGAVLLVLIGAALVMNQKPAPKVSDELRARSFVLVDSTGKQRAALAMKDGGGATLTFFDTEAKARTGIGVVDDDPILYLTDKARKGGAWLAVDADTPRLALADKNGLERVWLAIRSDSPVLQFFDNKRAARSGLTTFNDDSGISIMSEGGGGKPGMVLYDKDKKIVWSAP